MSSVPYKLVQPLSTAFPFPMWPNPVLSMPALEVAKDTFTPEELSAIKVCMIESMAKYNLYSISGPEIGLPYRVVMLRCLPHETAKALELTILFNPVLVAFDGKEIESQEGCVCFPEESFTIKRPDVVWCRAFLNGMEEEHLNWVTSIGSEASWLQHSLDHLEGRLLSDDVGPMRRDQLRRKAAERKEKLQTKPTKGVTSCLIERKL